MEQRPAKANKTSTAEHHPPENDPLRPLYDYEPKPAHRAGTELPPIGAGDHDPLRSPYAPRHVRARSIIEPQDRAAPPRSAHPDGDLHEPPAAHRRGEIVSNRDLERLQASLCWLQRQEAATRLAPETQRALALAPREAHLYAGSELVGLRGPPSLEPERMRPPPLGARRQHSGWPLRILIASCVTAPVLYYYSGEGQGPAPEPAPLPQFASFKQRFDAPGSIGQAETGPIETQKNDSGASIAPAHSFQQANVVPTGPPSAGETLVPPQPSSTATETPSPNNPVRMLGPEEIALLVNQGEQLVTAGDLATARSVLQRAAEAGDATAAVALAAIYDPSVLKKLGVVGIDADVEKARSWYQKAESLGSAEATRRLQVLVKP